MLKAAAFEVSVLKNAQDNHQKYEIMTNCKISLDAFSNSRGCRSWACSPIDVASITATVNTRPPAHPVAFVNQVDQSLLEIALTHHTERVEGPAWPREQKSRHNRRRLRGKEAPLNAHKMCDYERLLSCPSGPSYYLWEFLCGGRPLPYTGRSSHCRKCLGGLMVR